VGETSKIEWTDATWNPWWGCTKVSPACTNCYAETLANRFYNGLWRGQRRRMQDWNVPAKVDRRGAREGRRLRLFVASMADIFDDHPAVAEWRSEALRLLAKLRNVDVLLLTKRPQNILRMVPREWIDDAHCDFRSKPELWPAHVWVGTTVEDQQRADERIPHLIRVPARVRFLSVEPMLGPVDLGGYLGACDCNVEAMDGAGMHAGTCPATRPRVDWVIAGGESGPKARPSHPDWFRSVRDQCAAAEVPFLFKQWGEWVSDRDKPFRTDLSVAAWVAPDGRWGSIQPQPDGAAWGARIGKKAAGRMLDGVIHDGVPRGTSETP
jgi:protein gp37